MTKYFFLVFLVFCIGCRKTETQKKRENNEITNQAPDLNTMKNSKPKNLFELMRQSLEEGKLVNKKLGSLIDIDKASIIVDPESEDNIYLVFLLKDELTEEDFSNFKIHLDMFPYDEELSLLREDTKERNRKYDSWYFKPKIKTANGETLLYKIIDTPISNFRQIYIHLYDINKKEKVEESIVVKDLHL